VLDDARAQQFDCPSPDLALDAPALRTTGRLGRPPWHRREGGLGNQLAQADQRVDAIALEAAMRLRLDDHDPVGTDALIAALQQARLEFLRQRRGSDIEAQVNGVRLPC
jgi:hypothetical protein